jgi:hypothetical protein
MVLLYGRKNESKPDIDKMIKLTANVRLTHTRSVFILKFIDLGTECFDFLL